MYGSARFRHLTARNPYQFIFLTIFEENKFSANLTLLDLYIQNTYLLQVNLRAVLRTMKKYGVTVIGYIAWSLIDVYEWSAAFR